MTVESRSALPLRILEIVCDYAALAKGEDVKHIIRDFNHACTNEYCKSHILRNALKLHAIHYSMAYVVTLSKNSARTISNIIRPPGCFSRLELFLISPLLNRQIKYSMHRLHRKITGIVLEGLERALRSPTKDVWGSSFCAILILCLCMDNLHSDIYTFTHFSRREDLSDIEKGSKACQDLEDYPFQICTRLLHKVYGTHENRAASGSLSAETGFNPFERAMRQENMELDLGTEWMARRILGLMLDFSE